MIACTPLPVVGEADVVETDGSVGEGERLGAGPVDDRRLLVEQLVEALGGGEALVDACRDTLPSARIGCAAISSAVMKPMKSPTVLDAAGDAPVGEGDDAGDGDAAERLEQRVDAARGSHRLHAQL